MVDIENCCRIKIKNSENKIYDPCKLKENRSLLFDKSLAITNGSTTNPELPYLSVLHYNACKQFYFMKVMASLKLLFKFLVDFNSRKTTGMYELPVSSTSRKTFSGFKKPIQRIFKLTSDSRKRLTFLYSTEIDLNIMKIN